MSKPSCDAGVHALARGRAVDMRGVAGQEHAVDSEPVRHPVVDPELRRPCRLRQRRRTDASLLEHLFHERAVDDELLVVAVLDGRDEPLVASGQSTQHGDPSW